MNYTHSHTHRRGTRRAYPIQQLAADNIKMTYFGRGSRFATPVDIFYRYHPFTREQTNSRHDKRFPHFRPRYESTSAYQRAGTPSIWHAKLSRAKLAVQRLCLFKHQSTDTFGCSPSKRLYVLEVEQMAFVRVDKLTPERCNNQTITSSAAAQASCTYPLRYSGMRGTRRRQVPGRTQRTAGYTTTIAGPKRSCVRTQHRERSNSGGTSHS